MRQCPSCQKYSRDPKFCSHCGLKMNLEKAGNLESFSIHSQPMAGAVLPDRRGFQSHQILLSAIQVFLRRPLQYLILIWVPLLVCLTIALSGGISYSFSGFNLFEAGKTMILAIILAALTLPLSILAISNLSIQLTRSDSMDLGELFKDSLKKALNFYPAIILYSSFIAGLHLSWGIILSPQFILKAMGGEALSNLYFVVLIPVHLFFLNYIIAISLFIPAIAGNKGCKPFESLWISVTMTKGYWPKVNLLVFSLFIGLIQWVVFKVLPEPAPFTGISIPMVALNSMIFGLVIMLWTIGSSVYSQSLQDFVHQGKHSIKEVNPNVF